MQSSTAHIKFNNEGEFRMINRTGTLVAGMLVALLLSACATTSAPHPAVGSWTITIDTPIGAMNANVNINEDLTGEMTSQDLGAAPLNNIAVDGEALSFDANVDAQGTALTLAFRGTVVGDTMSGNFNTDFGAIPVSGTRN